MRMMSFLFRRPLWLLGAAVLLPLPLAAQAAPGRTERPPATRSLRAAESQLQRWDYRADRRDLRRDRRALRQDRLALQRCRLASRPGLAFRAHRQLRQDRVGIRQDRRDLRRDRRRLRSPVI